MKKRKLIKAGMAVRLVAALLLLCLVLAAAAVIAVLRDPDLLLRRAREYLAGQGVEISWQRAGLAFSPPRIFLDGVTLSADGARISAERVYVEPDVRSLLRREPSVRVILVRRARVALASRPGEPEKPYSPPDLSFLRRIFTVQRMQVTDSEVSYASPEGSLALRGLDLFLNPLADGSREIRGKAELACAGKGATAGCALSVDGTMTSMPRLTLRVEARDGDTAAPSIRSDFSAAVDLALTAEGVTAPSISLIAEKVTLLPGKPGEASFPLGAKASGSFAFTDRTGGISLAEISAGSLARASGSVASDLSGAFSVTLPDLAALLAAARPLLPPAASELALSGSLPLTVQVADGAFTAGARLSGIAASFAGASCAVSGTARAEGRGFTFTSAAAQALLGLSYSRDGRRLSGDLPLELSWRSGELSARTAFSGLKAEAAQGEAEVSGALEARGGSLASLRFGGTLAARGRAGAGPVGVSGIAARSSVSGTLQEIFLKDLIVTIPDEGLSVSGKALPLGPLEAMARVALTPDGLRVEELTLVQEDLGRCSGSLSVTRERGLSVRLAGSGISLEKAAKRASDILGRDALSGFMVSGRADVSLAYGPGTLLGVDANLAGLSFSSPDGAWMGQDLSVEASGRFHTLSLPLAFTARTSAAQGELLAKTIYLNLSKTGFWAEMSGSAEKSGIKGAKASATLRDMLSASAKGDVSFSRDLSLDVRAATKDLSRVYTTFVAEPMASSRPDLAKLSVTGEAELSASVQRNEETLSATGTARVRGAQVSRKNEKALVEQASLSLPFSCFFGKRPEGPAGLPRSGTFSAANLRPFPGAETGPVSLPVFLWANRLEVRGKLPVALWGGTATVSDLAVDRVFSPEFSGTLDAALDRISLEDMDTGRVKLSGSVSGRLSPIAFDARALTAGGDLSGAFFGGSLRISGISAADPLSPNRVLGGDMELSKVDLLSFTTALGAGTVTGRVDIGVAGLRLAHGQPVAFRLTARSVKEKGIPQDVSLAAVNSISVISSGQGITSMGVGLLTKVFSDFPYQELGFSCTLRNDVFSIRGLVHENGMEYLVKRPFFRGINVVNRNRDNTISFSDMLKRIKRVSERTGSDGEGRAH
ncbi:MAG: hypothetical protein AB1921_10125 [Thermodesulfobacteriota bacterium]